MLYLSLKSTMVGGMRSLAYFLLYFTKAISMGMKSLGGKHTT